MPKGMDKKMKNVLKPKASKPKKMSKDMPKMSLSEHKKMMKNMGRGY